MRDKHVIELYCMLKMNITHYVKADLLSSPRSRSKSCVTMCIVMLLNRPSNEKVRKLAPFAAMQHFAIRCLAFISSIVTGANKSACILAYIISSDDSNTSQCYLVGQKHSY